MYFNEKGNTNIDNQFKGNNKFDIKKLKPLLFVFGGIILLVIIIFIATISFNNNDKYTIELLGEENITLTIGNDYIESGYKAYDKDHNDITDQVKIISDIDTSKEGEYEILYYIGKTNKVRYVTVTKDTDATYIYLQGETTIYLEVGENYTEPGYKVYDSTEQNLTDKVKITGKVDTSKVGTYQITYSVINSKNITTTAKRTVIVVEKGTKTNN